MGSPTRPSSASAASSSTTTAPIHLSSKASAAAPKLNSEMEMGSLPADAANPPAAPDSDIMQVARVGDIAAMEKLFESGEFDATYADEEGITPLHVRAPRNLAKC